MQRPWSNVSRDIAYGGALEEETEPDGGVPSAAFVVDRFCWRCSSTTSILIKSLAAYRKSGDRRTGTEPVYHPGRKDCLSTQDLPFHFDPPKLSQRLIDPVPVSKVTNPSIMRISLVIMSPPLVPCKQGETDQRKHSLLNHQTTSSSSLEHQRRTSLHSSMPSGSQTQGKRIAAFGLGGLWAPRALVGFIQGHHGLPAHKRFFEDPTSGF